MSKRSQVNLALSEELTAKLDREAKRQSMTRSELVRFIVAQYLSGKLYLVAGDDDVVAALAEMKGRHPKG
jgi:metal-responsive CopG/Arc/MetJ family transcriptional regulator